jgi:hypothetical protein
MASLSPTREKKKKHLCSICGERMRSEEEHMQTFALTHVTILQSQLQHSATEGTILASLSAVPQQMAQVQAEVMKCAKTAYITQRFEELRAFSYPSIGEKFEFKLKGVAKLLRVYPRGQSWHSPVDRATDMATMFHIELYPNGDESSDIDKFAFWVRTVGIPACMKYNLLVHVGTQSQIYYDVENDNFTGHSSTARSVNGNRHSHTTTLCCHCLRRTGS